MLDGVNQFIEIGEGFGSSMAANLRNAVLIQSKSYFENFHKNRADEFRVMVFYLAFWSVVQCFNADKQINNEMWVRCPVSPKFTLSDIKVSLFSFFLSFCYFFSFYLVPLFISSSNQTHKGIHNDHRGNASNNRKERVHNRGISGERRRGRNWSCHHWGQVPLYSFFWQSFQQHDSLPEEECCCHPSCSCTSSLFFSVCFYWIVCCLLIKSNIRKRIRMMKMKLSRPIRWMKEITLLRILENPNWRYAISLIILHKY